MTLQMHSAKIDFNTFIHFSVDYWTIIARTVIQEQFRVKHLAQGHRVGKTGNTSSCKTVLKVHLLDRLEDLHFVQDHCIYQEFVIIKINRSLFL